MFKCRNCKLILVESDLVEGMCPSCNQIPEVMCDCDTGSCSHGIVGGIKVCDKCGEFMCPECGNHEVEVLSRITGYYSPVSKGSWNSAKVEELKNRHRYSSL